ncbi:MAG: hypothetical protein LBV39_06430, partial [Bacteroidales bacterium]|nr:hypothetical protein [Bacteroidales bacterium]
MRHSYGLRGWAFLGYLLISISVQAKDYYVALAATGAGDGSGVADAADITTLKTFLSGYNVATDPDLNIYFSAGTYIMDNVPFTFASNENNRSGLNVVFQPLNNDAVVLSGGSSVIRLLNMGSAKNETSPLTVSIRNMAIVNFYSTGAADNGTNSLFTLGDYNVLNLEVDSIDNISSNRLPLFLMGTSTAKDSYTTVNVYQSVIKNVRGRDYGIFDSMADKITLRFINSVLSGWQAGNSPTNHYMFYLDDDNASLTMSECTVKDCGMAFMAANRSTYTELTDVRFVNNTSLFHFFHLFGNASFAGLRVENNKVTTAGYDFFHFTGDEYDINNCVFTGNEASDNFIDTEGNLFVSNCIFDQNKTTYGVADFIYFHTANNYEFTDCRFTENESKMQFFRIAAGHLALNDTHFTKNKLSYAGDNYFFHLAAGELTTTDCVFDENTVTNTSNGTVRFFYFPAGKATITGTTISGNDMRTTYSTRQYLFSTASSLILVNNTFSGNLNGVTEMSITSPVGGCINNTFYDTGDIYVYSGSYSVVNNLLLSTTNITGATTGFKRNIYKNKFYASGISGGTSITDLNTYVDAGLSEYAAGKPKIHRLLRLTEVNHPILKQGGSTITTGYANYLLFDQRKKKRPAQISIGAWDMPNFDLMNGHYTIFYDADNGGLSPYYDIDMSRYIVGYPDGVDKDDVTFGAVTQPSTGTISTGSGNCYFRFTPRCDANDATQPALGMMDKPTSMT